MGLQEEIQEKSSEIKTDSYPMSIGELMNLYSNKEIDIHPEFQRFSRWTLTQKSKLIESILLGIPLPPIFVHQRKDGVWDVVDGLQRLSTIFQFVGILRDESDEILPPLVLEKTKELPSLKNKSWDDSTEQENAFTPAQRLYIKRSKIDVKIILKDSDENSKYELFQRLNTGGTQLSAQEIRNCLLIMTNKNMFYWLRDLARDNNYKDCMLLTERAVEEQYDMELALRFVIFRNISLHELTNIGDVAEYLTEKMLEISRSEDFSLEEEAAAFKSTFATLNLVTKENSFRKYDNIKLRFIGPFLVPAFEVIAMGIGYNYKTVNAIDIENKIAALWTNEQYLSSSGSGVRASTRIPKTIALGRELFGI